jgi:hypothetical protein
VTTAYQRPHSDSVNAIAFFVVGGVGQTIAAWVSGDIDMLPEQVIDQIVSTLDALAEPRPTLG